MDKQAELSQILAVFLSKKKTNETTSNSPQECSDFQVAL